VAIPGLSFRPYRGDEDLPGLLAPLNAAWRDMGIDTVETLTGLTTAYHTLTNCDLERDALIAEVDGDVVGYGRVEWREQPEGGRIYSQICLIPDAWGGRGLGTALFGWNARRIAEIAAEHERHALDCVEVWATDRQPAGHALARAAGFEAAAYEATMVRPDLEDLPDPVLPEGFEVRTPRPDEMRKVWEADVEAFRDHFGAIEPSEADFTHFLEYQWYEPELWRIAWDGAEVASQVRAFINTAENEQFGRRRGYTEDISTRRPYRRRGLARALLVMSLHALKERGMQEAALSVHTENPLGALDLYESVGFRRTLLSTIYRRPLR